jgi:hypothetical protein
MRPERTTSTLINSWRSTNKFVKHQLSNLTVFRAALIFSIFAGLVLSFTFSNSIITTAQEQKPVPHSNASSLSEAIANGEDVQSVSETIVETNADAPEGGSCTWTAGTVYPVTILDQATVAVGNNIYSFGGVSTAIVANSYRFDGTTWTPIAPLPVALEYPQAVTDGTNIYIMGGANSTGASVNTLYRYNVATDTYTTLAPMAVASWNHAAEFLNGKIYKFTGTAGTAGSTNALEIYDIATNTWTAGAPYPISVSFVSSFVRGGFIYGAGGIASVGSVASLKTYRYDPATNTWDDAAIADLPETRWGAASSRVPYGSTNAWVLAGGYVNGTATANISTSSIEWNPTTNAWTTNPPMTAERARMTGAVINVGGAPSFFVIGGRSLASSGFVGTNTNQRLTCVTNVAVINGGTVNITSESCTPANGAPDPGETLTVTLPITNTGDTPTTNLNVTLQATGGVVASSTQNFGVIAPGGAAVTRTFTFTVASTVTCGSDITLTFTPTDGTTTYPTITRTFTTGARQVLLSQNFDAVTAPALPAGWTTVQLSGTAINWVTTTTTPSSPPNAAFANDPATVNLSALVSPAVAVNTTMAQITFRNQFNTETNFDGMVLEYTTNGGTTWTDIITGGGTFVSGGYTGTLNTGFANPLPGRMAWTGNSMGYLNTVVNLPASLNGQTVQFRWLMGSDNAVAVPTGGVWIDDVQVLGARQCCGSGPGACQLQRRNDFNGDGRTDFSTFRPATGTWFILPNGSTTFTGRNFGATGDRLQPFDYDGDGTTDLGVYRNGTWFYTTGTGASTVANGIQFGVASDIPVIGDYVGDNKADLTVYRPATGVWYTRDGGTGAVTAVQWGGDPTDIPAPGDYDGDCKTDYAVRRTTNDPGPGNTTWLIRRSSGGATSYRWGTNAMQMALGDYDGDGRTDIGVVATVNGNYFWYVLSTANPTQAGVIVNGVNFGATGDVIVAGDYTGTAATDLAIWRPTTGTFSYRSATAGSTVANIVFGANGDIPTARNYQYPLLP